MINKLTTKILLTLIIILALALRTYRLDSVPPSLSWDEASVGYNAWTIANYGRDEYGKRLPLYFRSFGDDKHPIHIYATAIFTKLLGLNEFTTRLPTAFFGVLNVLLIYFLAKLFFKKEIVSLAAAFFLAISPYNLHFSHFNHEANFALFFFLLGLVLFYLSFKRKILLPISFLSFIICFLTYHPAKIVVPVTIFTLVVLYFKKLLLNRRGLIISFLILIVFAFVIKANPQLLGTARVSQTSLGVVGDNELLGRVNLVATQYSWHFSPQYLFISGDKNPRLSSQTGEFYKVDALFLILGVLYLIHKRSKESVLVLVWALTGPLPSSLVGEAPHAARSMFMMGSWHLISALGFYFIIRLVRRPIFKIIVVVLTVIILTLSLQNYLNYYYGEFAKRYAIDWQYGMKQIVEFVKQHEEYNQVFVTDIRSQPYIFFLYYLKPPLPDYLHTVIHNNNLDNRSYNNVASFDKYSFGGWDPIESPQNKGVLYVVTPSQYDGLIYKLLFDVKKVIYYPNGAAAFYLVSTK